MQAQAQVLGRASVEPGSWQGGGVMVSAWQRLQRSGQQLGAMFWGWVRQAMLPSRASWRVSQVSTIFTHLGKGQLAPHRLIKPHADMLTLQCSSTRRCCTCPMPGTKPRRGVRMQDSPQARDPPGSQSG